MSTLTPITRVTHYPDAADLAPHTDKAQCCGCHHWWDTAELSHDRNGDDVCPDCVWTWSAYPDHR